MVGSHHGMDDIVPLAYEAAWALLNGGHKLSAISAGQHLFSFRLRPAAHSTPPTVLALIGAAYLPIGWLRFNATQLEPLPLSDRIKQARRDAPERRAVYRLFDGCLLRGQLPTDYVLVSRDPIDAANERAYEEAQPDLYRFVIDRQFVSFLPSIRNGGRLTDGQEGTLRKWMAKEARSQFRVVPPIAKPEDDQAKQERERIEQQRRILREIERKEDEEEARRRDEDPDSF